MRGTLFAGVCGAALALVVADAALAQDAAAPAQDAQEAAQVDEIIVTGIRQSLQAARDIKRSSDQFVDAIVADDIGKLPDTNVAESLARVSGVQVERGIGEGTDISVRGLRENVILYNGRQIVDATGRGGNGLDQLGGSTYGLLGLVPSELIARLEVTKLAGADQIAGALGGIVDIRTRLPLASGGTQVALSAGVSYDQLAEGTGYELFGLISDTFAEDTLGLLLTASYSDRAISQQGLDTFSGYARYTDTTVTPSRIRFGNADVRAQEIEEQRQKLGFSAVAQWRPRDGVEFTVDTFYTKLESDRDRYWLSFTPTGGLTNATYSSNDILLSGRAAGAVLSNTEFADVSSEVWSSAVRGSFDISDSLSGSAEISYGISQSEFRQLYFRLQPIATITPTINFDFTDGDYGSFTIGGIDLTDPAQLRFTILFDQLFRAETETLAARTDWTLDVDNGFLSSLQAGLRINRLDSTQNPLRADIRPVGGIVASQLSSFVNARNNADFMDGEFAGLPRRFLVASEGTLTGCGAFTSFASVSQNSQCLNPATTVNSIAGNFSIEEQFTDGYGKVNFDGALGSAPLSGNLGLRYVRRELTSIGNVLSGTGAATAARFERTDEEFLPSAVAKLELGENWLLRAGAARVVAFPNTEDLNNGVTLANNAVFVAGVQTTPGTGSGGSPDLDPFAATQADLSLEWYFAPEAMMSAGLFYKDVSSFIVQRQSAESYAGTNYLINRKVNGDGATIQGLELLGQLPLSTILPALDGFGVVATYSFIDSETPIADITGRTLTFPGLSKNNINLVGYYEQGPVSFRLAYNWRDEYLVALSVANTGVFNDTYKDLSATFRYDFTDAVSLTVEGNNLMNSQQRTFDAVPEALRTNVIYGRIFKATLSARF
ncbi:TonB-dependent receptor [Brevundimonas sp.]|uniref:TonB-dependent receptor n=1 Tax=Brevundimonas sp. TaxID=1871086 RepID=UPI00286C07D1|nr:TonB-dependent receptor [Brevundimonas sp.]